jgi:peptidoglycan/LPS O-acetylase OafA/YrhL
MAEVRGVGGVSFARDARDVEHFIAGDSLRGIASVGVVFAHVSLAAGSLGALGSFPLKMTNTFDVGVYVFFVLSGYLLGRPYVTAFIGGRDLPRVGRYFRNRALRILPAFWVAWLATLVILGTSGSSIGRVLAVPLFVQTYFPSHFAVTIVQAWTLGVEVAFYVLLPLLGAGLAFGWGRRGTPAQRFWVVIGICVVIAAITFKLHTGTSKVDYNAQHRPLALLFGFTPGLALAAVSAFAPRWLQARPQIGRLMSNLFYAVFGLGLVLYVATANHWGPSRHAALAAPLAGLVVAAALVRQWTDGHCTRVLDNPVSNWLGKRSYSFYMFHYLVLRLIVDHIYSHRGKGPLVVMFLIEMAIMVPVAWAGYQWIERPFIVRRAPWRRAPAPAVEPEPAPAPSVATAG